MAISTREDWAEAFAALRASVSRVLELDPEPLTTPELMAFADACEVQARRLPVVMHGLINQLAGQATEEELGGKLRMVLANRLRITTADAGRRIAEARVLGPRRAMTGEALAPILTATAAAQCAGRIGDGHIALIRRFMAHLPATVDALTREAAEADLAGKATEFRPEQVAEYAHEVMLLLHPDGEFSDEERARQRGLVMGKQECDGMSRISGRITPELRAAIEALWAKLAAPGMGNPADEAPVIDGEPDADVARGDTRSAAQRNHDALLAGLRGLFASGQLGRHRGLPVTIIATTTVQDLEAAAGYARTAGGSRLPVKDLIGMAARGGGHDYLAIFEGAKPKALFHAKRLASAAQRIMLCAKDRGCTMPGCDAPAYHSEVHHVTGWTKTRRTDINDLTLACGPHNRLAEKGWTTRTNARGHTEWIPPSHLDHGQPRINTFHHPEKLLLPEDDDPE